MCIWTEYMVLRDTTEIKFPSFSSTLLPRNALCVSAVFAVARCPSVTLVHCIQTAEDIVKLLSRPGSPVILVFFTPSIGTQFQGEPLQQGRKIHGVAKFCEFWLKSPYISETVREVHGCFGTLIGNHRWRIDPCRFWWPWVTPTQFSRSQHFWSRMSKNGLS